MKIKKYILKLIKFMTAFSLMAFVIFAIFDRIYPLNLDTLNKDKSQILYDINGNIVRMKLANDDIWRFEVDEIPNVLKQSVLLFEDRYFYYHFGVNPFAIIRSAIHNLTHKNRIGASTISMQVARMLNPGKRSYANKFREIFRAFQLEWHFSKDEILNLYFTLAPYGGNIEGVSAATRFYFNKSLNKLSYAQMALLSTIPKNPNKNRLDKRSNINALKNRVVKLLYEAGIINLSEFKRAKDEPFKNVRFAVPQNAPSYSDAAFKNGLTHSNLNLTLQNDTLKILTTAMNDLTQYNANNAAAVVIDNAKMSVVAFIGSHKQSAKNGQNSALNMRRNVGSTLKPFIFSLALDDGLITPKSELIDTEIYINEYAPRNYSGGFLGRISATDALTLSLNIPAINLNEKLGTNSLYEMLKRANLVKFDKEYYGASIALGSSEMGLLNLAHLYTIYANDGVLRPLEFAGKMLNNQDKNITLISPQSAYLTAKMMSEASRSYLKNAWQFAKDTPQIAFKTGTSYADRDIYAVGLNKNYTIAVWIGNFDGKRMDGVTGLNDASKVVFDIFKLLSQRQNLQFLTTPNGIIKRLTCLDAYEFTQCKNLQFDEVILNVELKDKCGNLRGEELDFMYKNGYLSKSELAKSPCIDVLKSKKPIFATPYNGEILITDDNSTKVMLKCYAYLGDEIYLKIDGGEFIKTKNASENEVLLDNGKHTLSCLDENSNLNEIMIEIRR
ncbi:penicillin-binding protein 1C [Campylobacter sp. faydin G-105]|uniref:penicillin-binding protein 1C n=1 Tax=Campylobacter anatolicus TaxID=2829105 RepID=UPI001BA33A78|nr:penicillin-binding protein 1C [Campylobacter anatolicus]MBR8462821.1 penicillin-binding protein 1C [Campylobacter anatolicus]